MPEVITDNLDLWSSALLTRSTAGRGTNGKLEAYGIKKLRELILELAVRGKLVAQDPSDAPATILIEPDEELVAQLTFELPHGWGLSRLSDLAEINGGFAFKSTDYKEDGMRVIRISDFDEFGFKNHKVVRHPFTSELAKFCLDQNNILMAMTGGTVGKSYLVRSLPEPMIVNQRVATIKVSTNASPSYIDIVIRSEMTQEVIREAKNSTNDNISMGDIKGFAVPLPPPAEQHRIVAKVDELMALCDQLEQQQNLSIEAHQTLVASLLGTLTRVESQQEFGAAWARIANHFDTLFITEASIDQLKQTILQLAVMGKLNNSSTSKRVTLAELIELISGQHLLADEQNTEGLGIPYLTGPSDFGDKHPIPTRWTDSPKVIALPGDILVTVKGSGVGKTNKLVAGPTAISRQLMAVRVIGANPDFIHLVLQNAAGHFQASMTGIAIPGIGRKDVLSLETNLPPLEEQQCIVAKVDELTALCDTLKARLADAQAIQLHLADAIVEQAVS